MKKFRKSICLVSNDDYYIVVSLPASEVVAYQDWLNNDPTFRNSEIQGALGYTSNSRALPAGPIEYQSYMYREDIREYIEIESGDGAFSAVLTLLEYGLELAALTKLIELSKKDDIILFVADVLNALVSAARSYRVEWWEQAVLDICNGIISAVRYTIVQNTGEYPKVWRIFERIS